METVTLFTNFLTTVGTFLALTLGFALLTNKSIHNKANRYLGISILFCSFLLLPSCLEQLNLLDNFPHIIGLARLIVLMAGPLMYFYVQACTKKDFQFRPILLLFFLPWLLDLLYNLPHFLSNGSEKMAVWELMKKEGYTNIPIVLSGLKMIIGLVFYTLSVQTVLQYREHLENETSFIDKAFHRWLLFFSSLLLLPLIGLINYVLGASSIYTYPILYSLMFIYIFSVYLVTIIKPAFFLIKSQY